MNSLKGQSAIEFMMLVGLSLIMLTALTTVITQYQNQANLYTSAVNAQQISQQISFEVEVALTQGQGYSRQVTLPAAIRGQEYQIYVTESTTAIEVDGANYTAPSLYTGQLINQEISEDQNNVEIKHNETGVHIIETE